jgi:uncharacterized protein (DUF305 family)
MTQNGSVAAVLLVLVAPLTACGAEDGDSLPAMPMHSVSVASGPSPRTWAPSERRDTAFARRMVLHHWRVLVRAHDELTRDVDPELRSLARAVRRSQHPETPCVR